MFNKQKRLRIEHHFNVPETREWLAFLPSTNQCIQISLSADDIDALTKGKLLAVQDGQTSIFIYPEESYFQQANIQIKSGLIEAWGKRLGPAPDFKEES